MSTVLCDNYKGKKFNSPNDLWRDKKGGIYFTDPSYVYKKEELDLPGNYVFYLPADSHEPILVIDDLLGPNGIVGTKDGKLLYVADYSGRKTFGYIKSKTTAHCMIKNCLSPLAPTEWSSMSWAICTLRTCQARALIS